MIKIPEGRDPMFCLWVRHELCRHLISIYTQSLFSKYYHVPMEVWWNANGHWAPVTCIVMTHWAPTWAHGFLTAQNSEDFGQEKSSQIKSDLFIKHFLKHSITFCREQRKGWCRMCFQTTLSVSGWHLTLCLPWWKVVIMLILTGEQ